VKRGARMSAKAKPTPFPWRSTPPQTLPERWAFAADLAAVLNDSSVPSERTRVTFAASLLGLSGEELFTLGHLVCAQLKTLPVRGGVA
jgi:hypothetical protein